MSNTPKNEEVDGKKMNRRQAMGTGAKIGAAIVVGAAVAGSAGYFAGQGTATAGAAQTVTQTKTVQAAGEGTLNKETLAIGASVTGVDSMDPAKIFGFLSFTLGLNCYENLLRPNYDFTGEEPNIAESVTRGADHRTYTAIIDSNAKFSNGDRLTAKDVEYSWRRVLGLAAPAIHHFRVTTLTNPDNINALDDRTLEFKLEEPIMESLVRAEIAQLTTYGIVNPNQVEAHIEDGDFGSAWLETNSAGAGPFVLTKWEKDSEIILEANQHYWRNPAPAIKRIVIRHMPEATSQLAALQKGEIDIAWEPTPDMAAEARTTHGLRVQGRPDLSLRYIWMNSEIKPFDNEKVWEAVKWSLDYDGLVTGAMRGQALHLQGAIPQGLLGHNAALPYHKDIGKAKALLAEAGYPDGFDAEMVAPIGEPIEEAIIPKIQADLTEVGINVKVVKVPLGEFFGRAIAGDIQMGLDGWGGALAHPENYIPAWFNYDKGLIGAWFKWNDPAAAALSKKAAVATTDEEAVALYKEITDYGMKHGPFAIFMHGKRFLIHRTWVEGLELPFLFYYQNLAPVYKE